MIRRRCCNLAAYRRPADGTRLDGSDAVVTVILDEGGRNGETLDWLRLFWTSYYLRGTVLFDETGTTSQALFRQPATGLPFGRGFIIDRDGRVVVPYFGHDPRMVIATIRALVADTAARPPRRHLRPRP